jgi:peptidoglycan/LPS O-acetylase OafA/YrhL
MKLGKRFDSLDSFRGICALLVAFMHLPVLHHFYFSSFVRHSFLFVDFFFVLSGWVISYAYMDRLKTSADLKSFALRRFGRVWPLHVAVLSIFILFQLAALFAQMHSNITLPKPAFTGNWDPTAIPLHLLLIQAIHSGREGTWNLPSWSISVEFWTYIIFALLLILPPRRWVIPVSFLLMAGGLFVVFTLSPRLMDTTYDYGIFRCWGGFFAGVIAQHIWQQSNHRLSTRSWTLLEIAVLVAAIVFVSLLGATPWSILAPLIFVPVVYIFAHEEGFIGKFMQGKTLRLIGLWSFSIYMVHGLYALILFRNVPRILESKMGWDIVTYLELNGQDLVLMNLQSPWLNDVVALIYLLMVVATAAASYRYIEVPARDWFNRRASIQKVSQPESMALEKAVP